MTWPNFYLTCFLLGFSLSLVSFLLGAFHLHGLHLFHGHAAPHAGHAHGVHGPLGFWRNHAREGAMCGHLLGYQPTALRPGFWSA